MTKLYSVKSPADLATAFEHFHELAVKRVKSSHTQRDMRYREGEAAAWLAAADMVRNMDFEGWQTND